MPIPHTLIIAPGAASPTHPRYREAREALVDAASERGYTKIETLSYPGHDHDGYALHLDTSSAAIIGAIKSHCAGGGTPSILARSYGCYAAVRALIDADVQIERLVLWGPPPYWLMYEFWRRDLDRIVPDIHMTRKEEAAARFTRIDGSFFESLVPIEVLLQDRILASRLQHLVLATGEADPYCPPPFLQYLGSLIRALGNNALVCDAIPGVGHSVLARECSPDSWARYLDAVLGAW